jgi:aspartyl-tRNA(Asn)/glutamyl-tRNA(Gln) amidotransferase subunit C
VRIDVKKIAALASLPVSRTEEKNLEKELEETLGYIKNLSEINTEGIEPTSQVTGLENVAREDEAKSSLSQSEALSNSKSTQNGFFKTKGVLGNG